jgi:hypothetical protein
LKDTQFVCSILALKCWQEAHEEGLNGMMAVAFALRNRARAGWYGGNWIDILSNMEKSSARDYKIDPPSNLIPDTRPWGMMQFLQIIDNIFSGAQEDNITIKTDGEACTMGLNVPVALYWARLDQISNPWFLENIVRNPERHQRIAQVGQLFFFS